MQTTGHGFSEEARAKLREVVSTIDKELSSLSKGTTVEEYRLTTGDLRASWTELVQLLALGPTPALRSCPNCKGVGMREATRCGYCWTELSPSKKDDLAAVSHQRH